MNSSICNPKLYRCSWSQNPLRNLYTLKSWKLQLYCCPNQVQNFKASVSTSSDSKPSGTVAANCDGQCEIFEDPEEEADSDKGMKKMTSFLKACKPVAPTNTALVTQKELDVVVTLFKTKTGGVDKLQAFNEEVL